jgi:hypothetical protein
MNTQTHTFVIFCLTRNTKYFELIFCTYMGYIIGYI